ncbi:hypothetical protein Micbo1qcDRAFT_43415 [Microdochium bolleyi]|uniref:Uncharacterized protein n=1 Tax=Microdochium bolleyi TaxID=196109 RepID=A0A136JAZ1_9PEZI|nr:hypothetical protein Micbo1qcDRAFT_43415 [Microdochium bolleyi]
MTNNSFHDFRSSTVSWTQQGAPMQHATDEEVVPEADEPPDDTLTFARSGNQFRRTVVRKISDHHESLLTKALHQPEDDVDRDHYSPPRRRSMTSNVSVASTVDLVSDVSGVTSPSRSNTPSPPPPVFSLGRLNADMFRSAPKATLPQDSAIAPPTAAHAAATAATAPSSKPKDGGVDFLAKKRCISFACGANKSAPQPSLAPRQSPPAQPAAPVVPGRRPCIKFACPTKLDVKAASPKIKSAHGPPPKSPHSPRLVRVPTSPSVRKHRSSSSSRPRSHRSSTPRPTPQSPCTPRSKQYLQAGPDDLDRDSSRFHEFATDEPQEEQWIRDHYKLTGKRITVNDTLRKELEIRRLGKEVEEEEEEEEEALEEAGDDANLSGDGDDDNDDEDGDDEDDEDDDEDVGQDDDFADSFDAADDVSVYGSGDDGSDGYHTDNEVGFAESDDDDDAEDFQLWNPGQGSVLCLPADLPASRRPSMGAGRLDSTSSSDVDKSQKKPTRRIKIRPGTPELPDSTDFVCGTLDEDRALEDAYISCVAARRREKLHVIPQDIDPSFPTSEPDDDDEDEDERRQSVAHDSDDQLWIHGNMEDINHDRVARERRAKHHPSPRRHRSPPPKRARSPAPLRIRSPPPKIKLGGRSPQCLFGRQSPRQLLSPPLHTGTTIRSPPASLVQTGVQMQRGMNTLAFRPGPTQTKSLPRAAALFPPHLKAHRRSKHAHASQKGHMRGAIDIVKGLEQKRQRRKEKEREKYFQKHCNMARKGQIHEKRPQPGKGAERMREIGLLMANKRAPAGFVLSV